MILNYRHHAQIEDLAVGECTVHRASSSSAARWWQLWFLAPRDTDAEPEIFCVPVNPKGSYVEAGPGGRTWGLQPSSGVAGVWTVSPSINVLRDGDALAGTHTQPSIFHQNVQINNVPADELWATGAAP